jgi:polyisoprenoid-binding protein YceI
MSTVEIAPTPIPVGSYTVDPAHSSFEFGVRHMKISTVRGRFLDFQATLEGGEQPRIEGSIETGSAVTYDETRDGHLKSPDFFDVEKFPTITFKSKKVERAGEGKWKVTGDLTLHGVTKEAVLEVQGPMPPIKDPMGNVKSGASATTTIDRKDFGIVWNKAMDGGGVMVGDDVAITVNVEAVKKGD